MAIRRLTRRQLMDLKCEDKHVGDRLVLRHRPTNVRYTWSVRLDNRQVAEFVWYGDALAHAQKLAAELEAK